MQAEKHYTVRNVKVNYIVTLLFSDDSNLSDDHNTFLKKEEFTTKHFDGQYLRTMQIEPYS